MSNYECNREMLCPYCGKTISVGEPVGIVDEKVVLDTKYSLIFFGVRQTDTVRNYSVYGCCDCCKKRNIYDTIVAWVYGVITFVWLIISIYIGIPMLMALWLLLAVWAIIGLPAILIKLLLKIRKASFKHAQECNALV